MKVALTIAGSDSGGGAGIQADLRTFAAHRVHGASAITAVTAQNTVEVTSYVALEPAMVAAQIDAVASDMTVAAAKTGMLANQGIIAAVADAIARHHLPFLVVDPVMVAKSGDRLLDDDAVHALRATLLRLARVVTPNIPEAEVLTGMAIGSREAMREAAHRLSAMGCRAVLLKGGHLTGEDVVDILLEDGRLHEFSGPRITGPHTHGTGCAMAAAVAAGLARGADLVTAVGDAKAYVAGAMRHGLIIGRGHQPLDHFWRFGEGR